MKSAKIILCVLGVFVLAPRTAAQTANSNKRIVIAARAVLDGKGGVLRDTRIVVEGARIFALDAKAGPWTTICAG
jgi:hypothetical protein